MYIQSRLGTNLLNNERPLTKNVPHILYFLCHLSGPNWLELIERLAEQGYDKAYQYSQSRARARLFPISSLIWQVSHTLHILYLLISSKVAKTQLTCNKSCWLHKNTRYQNSNIHLHSLTTANRNGSSGYTRVHMKLYISASDQWSVWHENNSTDQTARQTANRLVQ